MPFPVTCSCGRAFMAQDWLAGQIVACPACGAALAIPALGTAPPALGPPAGSGTNTLDGWNSSAGPAASGPGYATGYAVGRRPPTMHQANSGMNVKLVLAIAGGVVGVVLVAIVLAALCSSRPRATAARGAAAGAPVPAPAKTSAAAPQPVAVAPKPVTGPSQPAAGPPQTPTTPVKPEAAPRPPWAGRFPRAPGGGPPPSRLPSGRGSATTGPRDSSVASGRAPSRPAEESVTPPAASSPGALTVAIERWHTSAGPLRGSRPVGDDNFVLAHYGWQCELLPFLGHSQLYDQFDFGKSWTDARNAKLCTTVVPEFLNPADDRQQWTGVRLRGLALTHFVGMSGIEDGRSVVAATLPRTDPRAGVFGYTEVARREAITDGTSQTIMLLGSGEIVAPWVQGGGATVRGAREPYFDPLTGFGSRGLASRGAAVLMADGATYHLHADVDPAVFRALCTIHGGESVDVARCGVARPSFPGTR